MSADVQFNLLDAPWIPVLLPDGTVRHLGARETLAKAHEILDIAAPSPMDFVSLVRFLTALLCHAHGQLDRCSDPARETLPDVSDDLLAERAHFNLFGSGPRFYQYLRSDKDWEFLSATYLLDDVPTGSTPCHFRHVLDTEAGLCPRCCALGLVRIPAFATAAGRGKTPGINGQPPVYALPLGRTLAETLRLSWRRLDCANIGTPAWLDPWPPTDVDKHVPSLVGLTFLPRQVWLEEPSDEGVCVYCGEQSLLVRRTLFAPVRKPKFGTWVDPHVLVRPPEQPAAGARQAARSRRTSSEPKVLRSADVTGSGRYDYLWLPLIEALYAGDWASSGRVRVVLPAIVDNYRWLEVREIVLCLPAETVSRTDVLTSAQSVSDLATNTNDIRLPSPSEQRVKNDQFYRAMHARWRAYVEGTAMTALNELIREPDKAVQKVLGSQRMSDALAKSLAPYYTIGDQRYQENVRKRLNRLALRSARISPPQQDQAPRRTVPVDQYIAKLQSIGIGPLHHLRNATLRDLHEDIESFDLFTGLWWPLRSASAGAPRRRIAWSVAKLQGAVPLRDGRGATFPKLVSSVARRLTQEQRKSLEQRFDALLQADLRAVEAQLSWFLRFLRKHGATELDWGELTNTLSRWELPGYRARWARDYLASSGAAQMDADSVNNTERSKLE